MLCPGVVFVVIVVCTLVWFQILVLIDQINKYSPKT